MRHQQILMKIGLNKFARRFTKMTTDDLKYLGESIGVRPDPEGAPKTGRPVGSRGPLPNVKTMTKRELMSEVGKRRKELKQAEDEKAIAPEGGAPGAPGAPGLDESAVGGFIGWIIYGYVAPRLGNHWKLEPKEIEQAGHECAPFVNKYAPYVGKWQEEVRAMTWAVATFAPRWEKTRELKAKAVHDQEKAEVGLEGHDKAT